MAGLWLEWYNMPMAITAEKDTTLPAGARSPALTSALYGLAHLVVDYGSVSTLYHVTSGGLFSAQWIVALTVLFDYTAFALQMFLGPLLDRLAGGGKHHNAAGLGAAVGCALVAGGVWLAGAWPLGAVLAVAVGSALFHVGGGSVVLRLDRRRAVWPGLFVAPGALGLFLGKAMGGNADIPFLPVLFTALLAAAALPCLLLQPPGRSTMARIHRFRGMGWVVAALLLTVALRSLTVFSLALPLANGWPAALALAVMAFGGKALGGFLADRFGWSLSTAFGLLLGAALLGLGSLWPPTALAGVLCVNLTMAVTVAALAYLLPGWEGLVFGLTATALVIGLAPTGYGPWLPFLQQPAVVAGWCVLSAAALYPALRAVERLKK